MKRDGSGPARASGRNPEIDFKGEKCSNKTHQSSTDPEARLFKKGKFTEAKLRYMTHALSENRNGLIVDVETTEANGRAEWEAARRMLKRSVKKRGATVGADKGYDTEALYQSLRQFELYDGRHDALWLVRELLAQRAANEPFDPDRGIDNTSRRHQ
ncbi:MAG: transposase [Zoogloeaceae bacterium]|nr:transposase [Zoogloeaceae bacterium]